MKKLNPFTSDSRSGFHIGTFMNWKILKLLESHLSLQLKEQTKLFYIQLKNILFYRSTIKEKNNLFYTIERTNQIVLNTIKKNNLFYRSTIKRTNHFILYNLKNKPIYTLQLKEQTHLFFTIKRKNPFILFYLSRFM